VANADLETLEGLIAQFSIFDTIGAALQELRRSDFLAFLLDPQQNHRFGNPSRPPIMARRPIWVLTTNMNNAPVYLARALCYILTFGIADSSRLEER
jgi:hypothetical protein